MLKIILFALLAVAGTRGSLEPKYYKEGESCFFDRFPNATCQYKENCKLLSKLVESGEINIRKVPTCKFQSANPNEMFCCPKDPVVEDPSISPKHPQTPQHQFTVSVNSKDFYHLGAFGYYTRDLLDNEYRCTGVVLGATHVLGTSACIFGNLPTDNPHLFQLRTNDGNYEDVFDKELKQKKNFNNDLNLFEFGKHFKINEEFTANGYQAPLCKAKDVTNDATLVAIGFGQDRNGENCDLFTQQLHLEDLETCRGVQNQRGVQGLRNSHFCLAVVGNGVRNSQCRKCLTASSSVLHVRLPNGKYCVAGIATPTTNICDDTVKLLYYTNILSDSVSDFLNLTINRKSHRQ